jgi:hypothetical protein
MPTILRPFAGVPRDSSRAPAARLAQYVRRSRALSSLVPALLASGAITLAMTMAILHIHAEIGRAFAGSWMETWLTSWAFAYPLIYLLMPMAKRFAAFLLEPPPKHRRRR